MSSNSLKKVRESLLMSKTELARKANVSPITIARIEKGMPCRMETSVRLFWPLVTVFLTKTKYLAIKSISCFLEKNPILLGWISALGP